MPYASTAREQTRPSINHGKSCRIASRSIRVGPIGSKPLPDF
jgi:hypothetical protein